jgi:hypothetical protein
MSEPRGTPLTLQPVDRFALRWLAAKDKHDNMSAAARKLIDQVMKVELGEDWESKVAHELNKVRRKVAA